MKTVISSLVILGASLVQAANIVVQVAPGGKLEFNPSSVVANIGDTVEFDFTVGNHSVAQSSFNAPCQPLNSSAIWSGFMPISAAAAVSSSSAAAATTAASEGGYGYMVKRQSSEEKTFTITIGNTGPMWIYCAQAKHCQSGMSMVINVNNASNKTLAAYQAAASKVATNVAPTFAVQGGVIGGSSSSSSSGTPGSSTPGSTVSPSAHSGASAFGVGSSAVFAVVVAVIYGFFATL